MDKTTDMCNVFVTWKLGYFENTFERIFDSKFFSYDSRLLLAASNQYVDISMWPLVDILLRSTQMFPVRSFPNIPQMNYSPSLRITSLAKRTDFFHYQSL